MMRRFALVLAATALVYGSSSSDEKTVAALDTEYQAAVKDNDAATMARIFDDNFVLVTGKGRVQTRADLLKEGTEGSKPFGYKLWFSDIYARTPKGWRSMFGQASTRLP